MNTSEVGTFFGPPASPLFGVLHLPKDQQIRGGVVICGSLGREGINSVRLQRILANDLADRGFGVLRFDYLGTGDSAYTQSRDDAVDNWRLSVGYALSYLKDIGAQSITAIGLRAGCLILNDVLAGSHRVDRVVYVDPAGTGRRYLREQTALFMVSVGDDSPPPGTVSIIGARLSAPAAKEFRALSLDISRPGVDHLLVLRAGELDAKVSALAEIDRAESLIVDDLAESAQPGQLVTPIPLKAIDGVIDWVDATESTVRTSATPRYATSARMPGEGRSDGHGVIECIESIGPSGLFAIRTRPEHSLPGEGKVVVFNASANDPHVGPSREWVELSRRIAESGAQALRWDRSGVGQSGPISRKQWRPIYTRRDVRAAIDAAEHAATDVRDVQMVGPCSGSWYAAQAARAAGSGSVVLINPRIWSWQIGAIHLRQWSLKRSLHGGAATGQGTASQVLVFMKRAVAYVSRTLQKAGRKYTPHFVLILLGRLGLVQVPEVMLAALARSGAATIVLLSPWDTDLFTSRGGYTALKRLDRVAVPPRLVTTQDGDHALYHQAMLEALRRVVIESLTANSATGLKRCPTSPHGPTPT